ncbi:MAG: response regulator transcription factor [Acidimicrobiales bacterium]
MAVGFPPRVLIADDHAPTRAVVRRAVEEDGFLVCAEAPDANEAIRAARETEPDVALLDIRMPGSGIRAARIISSDRPEVSIVMLTVSAEDADLYSAFSAGATGYMLKGQDPAKVPKVLRMVLSGEAAVPGALVKRFIREHEARDGRHRIRGSLPSGTRLTDREWEVLEALNDGLGTAEISRRLFVADVTVRSHVAAIVRKLQVNDRAGVLRLLRD